MTIKKARDPWREVNAQLTSLGHTVHARFGELASDGKADRTALEQALRSLQRALEETASAASDLVREPALRKQITELVTTVRDALTATFATTRDDVRQRVITTAKKATPRIAARSTAPHKSVRRAPAAKPATTKLLTKAARS